MASLGHPLLGDSLYCLSDMSNHFSRAALHAWKLNFQLPFPIDEAASDTPSSMLHNKNAKKVQIALWAVSLTFPHPTTKDKITIHSDPPEIWPWTEFEVKLWQK